MGVRWDSDVIDYATVIVFLETKITSATEATLKYKKGVDTRMTYNKIIDFVPEQLIPLLPLEEKLILAIPLGLMVSYNQVVPIEIDQIGESQSVRSEFLVWVLTTPDVSKNIHHKGLQLKGANILGILDLGDSHLECPLRLMNCLVEDIMILDRGKYKLLDFTGSLIGPIQADSIQVQHDIIMKDGFKAKGEVRLAGANIGGGLYCDGGKFENPGGYALYGDSITTQGSIFLRNGFNAKGEVRLPGANIGGDLDCCGGKFENPGGNALLGDSLTTKDNLFLGEGFKAIGIVRLPGADIGGNLSCSGGEFENLGGFAFAGDGLSTNGAIFLRNGFKAKGEVRLPGVNIGGYLDCNQGLFENPGKNALTGDGLTTKGDVSLRNGFKAMGVVSLAGANIGNNLDCSEGDFENPDGIALCGDNMKVGGSLILSGLRKKPKGSISLENTTLSNLVDDEKSWPDQGNLNIDGLVYGPFASQVPADSKSRLRWLDLQNPDNRNVQPYEQLIRVYGQMGLREDARNVAIAKQKFIRKRLSGISRLWSWILDITISYGYKPEKVILLFIVPIILFGSLVFAGAFRVGVMEPTSNRGQQPGTRLIFDPVGYSLDVFLPIVDLHQERAWDPNPYIKCGILFQYYLYLHIMAGWFFTTLAVAAVTGLVRRD